MQCYFGYACKVNTVVHKILDDGVSVRFAAGDMPGKDERREQGDESNGREMKRREGEHEI